MENGRYHNTPEETRRFIEETIRASKTPIKKPGDSRKRPLLNHTATDHKRQGNLASILDKIRIGKTSFQRHKRTQET
jgi:hypothetical protein